MAAQTPIPVGTSTPVMLWPCNCGSQYLKVTAYGGTVGTDGCYIVESGSAGLAQTCSNNVAPSPAPNAASGAQTGDFVATGPGNPLIYNSTTGPGWSAPQQATAWMGGSLWGVCTAGGMTMTVEGIRPK